MATDGWGAAPSEARWYGFVVIGRDVDGGTETDHVDAYSAAEDRPDTLLLVPDGWEALEVAVQPTPRHPDWRPPFEWADDELP